MKMLQTINDIDKPQIDELFEEAQRYSFDGVYQHLRGYTMLSYEPGRVSFYNKLIYETAMIRSGGSVINYVKSLNDINELATVSGEINDLILSNTSHVVKECQKPVILNPEDDSSGHSNINTLDAISAIFEIKKRREITKDLKVLAIGSNDKGQIKGLNAFLKTFYDINIKIISGQCKAAYVHNGKFHPTPAEQNQYDDQIMESLKWADVIYLTKKPEFYGQYVHPNPFSLQELALQQISPSAIILHPLPRGPECPDIVTKDKRFVKNTTRNKLGLAMAILSELIL